MVVGVVVVLAMAINGDDGDDAPSYDDSDYCFYSDDGEAE